MPKIIQYKATYKPSMDAQSKTSITLQDENGADHVLPNLTIEDASYVLELLRFEFPIFYDPATQILTVTDWQQIGGESK